MNAPSVWIVPALLRKPRVLSEGSSLFSVEQNAASQPCFGLKAWDVTAWGGAHSAQPQVR